MEIHRHTGFGRLDMGEQSGDRRQERQHNNTACRAGEEIAERQTPRFAGAGLRKGWQGAAKIGSQHQRQQGSRSDQSGYGERCDQQDEGYARMTYPGQSRSNDQRQYRLAR